MVEWWTNASITNKNGTQVTVVYLKSNWRITVLSLFGQPRRLCWAYWPAPWYLYFYLFCCFFQGDYRLNHIVPYEPVLYSMTIQAWSCHLPISQEGQLCSRHQKLHLLLSQRPFPEELETRNMKLWLKFGVIPPTKKGKKMLLRFGTPRPVRKYLSSDSYWKFMPLPQTEGTEVRGDYFSW